MSNMTKVHREAEFSVISPADLNSLFAAAHHLDDLTPIVFVLAHLK